MKVKTYSLTEKGIRQVMNFYYFSDFINSPLKKVIDLQLLFQKIKTDYSDFLPELFQKLPVEYCVCFYPYFNVDLTEDFLKLLQTKSDHPNKTSFLINNFYFECYLPLTDNEISLFLDYLEQRIADSERTMLDEIKNKKELLRRFRSEQNNA